MSSLIVDSLLSENLFSIFGQWKTYLSPAAIVAGFTNMSLHTEIILFMIFPSEVGNSDFNYDVVKT